MMVCSAPPRESTPSTTSVAVPRPEMRAPMALRRLARSVTSGSRAQFSSVLENCALEPEVTDLANLLNAMGARISGLGTATLVVDGVDSLGGAEHTIIPDRIEGGTYLIGAAMTRGDVLLENGIAADLAPLLDKLADAGATVEVTA